MAINFPTSLDVFTDPSASDQLNLPSHSGQHTDLNNAVEALEAKVGIDSSAVTTSHDYKIAQLEARNTAGLVLISRTTIGTAVSSVTVSGAFSADYDSYKIIVQGGASSTSNGLWLTLGATTTGYYNVQLYQVYTSGTTTANSVAGTNETQWAAGRGDTTTLTLNADVHSPFASEYTTIGYQWFRANDAIGYGGGYLNNTTSYTAFTITASTGTITGGTIDLYGYAKA